MSDSNSPAYNDKRADLMIKSEEFVTNESDMLTPSTEFREDKLTKYLETNFKSIGNQLNRIEIMANKSLDLQTPPSKGKRVINKLIESVITWPLPYSLGFLTSYIYGLLQSHF